MREVPAVTDKVSVRHGLKVSVRHGQFFNIQLLILYFPQNALLQFVMYTDRYPMEVFLWIWPKEQNRVFDICTYKSKPASKMCPSVTDVKFNLGATSKNIFFNFWV